MAVHQHRVALTRHHLLLLAIGLPEYRQVCENHNGAWNPEGNRTRYNTVRLVDNEFAAIGMSFHEVHVLLGRVPTDEYGQKGEQCRRDPRIYQHNGHHAFGHIYRILERFHNRIVSVHGNATQMQNAGCREINIQAVPQIADKYSEIPTPSYLNTEVKRHSHHSHHNVGHSQGHYKVIRYDS